jgi:ribosomal protein S27AE
MNSSRGLGIVLTLLGVGIAVIAGLWIASQVGGGLTAGGALVGAGVAFVPVLLLMAGGVYLYLRGGVEAQEQSVMQKQRKLMDMVKTRGQISVNDAAVELGVPMPQVKEMVHQLVGLQVFSGYVNWDEGTLYSVEANQLRELNKCKNCGGELKLAGKGVVTCPFCGTEYFLR